MKDEKTIMTAKVEDVLEQIQSEREAQSLATESADADDGTIRDAVGTLPSEQELSDMSAEQRADIYKKLLSSIDNAVNDRVKALRDEYDRGIESARDTTVKQAFSNSDKFGGFGENIVAIDGIISKVPVLSTLPADQKYTLAYLINEGLSARKSKMGMSAEDIVNLVNSRPDAMSMLEAQRAKELSAAYGTTPAFSASSGAASMPANIRNTPRNLDEASREAYSSFGIKI